MEVWPRRDVAKACLAVGATLKRSANVSGQRSPILTMCDWRRCLGADVSLILSRSPRYFFLFVLPQIKERRSVIFGSRCGLPRQQCQSGSLPPVCQSKWAGPRVSALGAALATAPFLFFPVGHEPDRRRQTSPAAKGEKRPPSKARDYSIVLQPGMFSAGRIVTIIDSSRNRLTSALARLGTLFGGGCVPSRRCWINREAK
jgi:hypothetical protein